MIAKALQPLMSSGKDDWETPETLFTELDKEFNFEWDVCASKNNTKVIGCYFDEQQDGLAQNWAHTAGVVWMNPPYSRGQQSKWIAKAALEATKGITVVALLPARTDTKAFHQYIYNQPNVVIRFLKGRLKFVGAKNSAPFPSMIVIFKPWGQNAG
jgi:site-specific DNA-methyltransferase (adenine-specific)